MANYRGVMEIRGEIMQTYDLENVCYSTVLRLNST